MSEQLRVAHPCDRRWNELVGGGDRRFCTDCHTRVHNLDAMSAADIQALRRKGGFCARYTPNKQGAFVIRRQRVGLARIASAVATAAASVLVSLLNGCGGGTPSTPKQSDAETPTASAPSSANSEQVAAQSAAATGAAAQQAQALQDLELMGYVR